MNAKFTSAAMAEGYAKSRPPLHARIVERIAARPASVLDVGCGAGLSTRPLLDVAARVTGVDPAHQMVKWARRVARRARFVAGRVEALPFRDASFDLITAAGSLNYADPAAAFPELRRVIAPAGTLAVYDFDQVDFPYERPRDGSIPLSPEILARVAAGFRLARSEALDWTITMTMEQYLAYLLTETDVVPTLAPWSEGDTTELRFRGYIAWLTPVGR